MVKITTWTLGGTAGTNTLRATSAGLAGSPVTFSATGTAGPASSIAVSAGNNQSATAGTAVAVPPSAIVRDANSNPVAGVSVTFAVASGGGTVVPTTAITTDASGIAQVTTWTLGGIAGTNTLRATSAGLAGSPVTFTATGTTGTATQIALNAGDKQSATVNTNVATPPSVVVRDAANNPVAGVSVTFAVTGGSGTVSPTGAVSTNASGIAAVTSWKLGTAAGPNTLTATAAGLAGSPVTFTATGTAGDATQLAVNAGNNQTATAGTAVSTPPSAIVKDAFGNPKSGVNVTFAVTAGGGAVVPTTAIATNASGIAQVTSWTLGTTAGTNTLRASASGLSSVTFTATGMAGPAAQIAISAGNNQTADAGAAVAVPPSVLATDANGNPVSGVGVSVAVASGGGIVVPTTPVSTGGNGIAAATTWTLGATAGANTLTATATDLAGSPLTFTATGTVPGSSVTLVGAGDIAMNGLLGNATATAALLDSIGGPVFTAGDNVQDQGTTSEFTNWYDPTWGRAKGRTRPAPGNHEYATGSASAYFTYFGAAAGTAGQGWYSYDLGSWHIIVLNSMNDFGVGIDSTSAQGQWLKADLTANTKQCILAIWHYPRYSSSTGSGPNANMSAFWVPLYRAHATLVLNGHEHVYERFAPMSPDGQADPVHGIRQFTVGTGGDGLYTFTTPMANSEKRGLSHGVLKLTLSEGSYSWQFIPIGGSSGETFTDSGSGTCSQ